MNKISGKVSLESKYWWMIYEYGNIIDVKNQNELFELILTEWFHYKGFKINENDGEQLLPKILLRRKMIVERELLQVFNELSHTKQWVIVWFLQDWFGDDVLD